MMSFDCDVKQQAVHRCAAIGAPGGGHRHLQLADIYGNTVLNQNESAPAVTCGQETLTVAEFEQQCGMTVGAVSARRPDADEIKAMARRWLEW